MLQTIRDYTQGWIATVIIGLIIISFAIWGVHSYFVSNGNETIAAINGVEITQSQLSSAYEKVRRQIQLQHGPNSPLLSKDSAKLREITLRNLINTEALRQAAIDQGFRITDTQVDRYLQSLPAFQVDGQFSVEKFQEVLSANLLSTNEFLDLIRSSLLTEQPKSGIILSAFITPKEVQQTAALLSQERDIGFLLLPTADFIAKPMTVTPEKIKAYYNQHKDAFMTDEQVSIDYIALTLEDIKKQILPNDAVLKTYYDENKASFKQEKEQDSTFETAKLAVTAAYIKQQADEKFAEKREQLANLTYEHPDSLQAAAKELGLSIQTTPLFTKNMKEKDITQYANVRNIAFSKELINTQNNSDVIEVNPEAVIVLRIKSHQPAALQSLALVENQIRSKVQAQSAVTQNEKLAQDVLSKLRSGVAIQELTTPYGYNWTRAGFVGRFGSKHNPAIVDKAFRLANPNLSKSKTVYDLVKVPEGYAVVGVFAARSGTLDAKELQSLTDQGAEGLGQLEYMLYEQSQIEKAKIKVYN